MRDPRKIIFYIAGALIALILAVHYSNQPKAGPTTIPPSGAIGVYNPQKICDDAYDKNFDFSGSPLNHFALKLQDGCFSGWVHFPKWWKNWDANAAGDQTGYWVALWYDGEQVARGPFYANDKSSLPHGTHDLFRVQGHGTVIFYTNAHYIGTTSGDSGEQSNKEQVPATKPLGSLQVIEGDSHYCDKPDDVQYEGSSFQPRFELDIHNNGFSNSSTPINWANGFKGTVPVCFIVDEKGNPTAVHLLHSLPDAELEKHITQVVEGWRYQPGKSQDDRLVKTQMLEKFLFY